MHLKQAQSEIVCSSKSYAMFVAGSRDLASFAGIACCPGTASYSMPQPLLTTVVPNVDLSFRTHAVIPHAPLSFRTDVRKPPVRRTGAYPLPPVRLFAFKRTPVTSRDQTTLWAGDSSSLCSLGMTGGDAPVRPPKGPPVGLTRCFMVAFMKSRTTNGRTKQSERAFKNAGPRFATVQPALAATSGH